MGGADPYYTELSGFGRAASAPLKREPANWQLAEHYALDHEDRVVVSRSYRDKGVRAVAEHRPEGPVGAIGLGFDCATLLHPVLGIQSERDLKDETKDSFERWNPGDMTVPLVPFDIDPEVEEALAGINRHIEDTDDEKLFRSFQRRLAKTLNARDWSAELTPSPDFAVIVMDLDDDEPMTGVRATLPKPIRQRLAGRGLVCP